MNKSICCLALLVLYVFCKTSGETVMNFDRQARELQEKINDENYTFYHEKHPVVLETQLILPSNFRSENELKSGSFIYRLQIDETGKFTYRAIKPAPNFFEPQVLAVLNNLKFKPAWIGSKNFLSQLDIQFIIEFEAY